MALPMQEDQYLAFYRDSVFGCSKAYQKYFVRKLMQEGRITDDDQCSISDKPGILVVEKHQREKSIITQLAQKSEYSACFEYSEFTKLYKYSVPFFFSMDPDKSIPDVLHAARCRQFEWHNFKPDFTLSTSINEDMPYYYEENGDYFIKFVLQKVYISPEDYQPVDYRYPVVIYINVQLGIVEIRFDAVRFDPKIGKECYENLLGECIDWIIKVLQFKLFLCDGSNATNVINNNKDESVKIYKQMMQLSSGGSAELTASEDKDSVMPFIGELRELIDENEEMFSRSSEIKDLLLSYLNEKEATASYPYIYIKRVKPVESNSYILKITFDYFLGTYTILQHQTGTCRDLGMERMNDAIKYLCESGSFTKGDPL